MNIDLGESTDFQVLQDTLELSNRRVVDIGCGKGEFAAAIAGLGAQVSGIEPDPVQAASNRNAKPVPGLDLFEAGAQSLPLESTSQDVLLFRFSLHHIPPALYPEVLNEAARVLKPGGSLYIMEPVAQGSSQYVMELFHDETRVRAKAQQALTDFAPAYFEHRKTYNYTVVRHYDDFEAYVKRYGKLSYNSYALDTVDNASVKNRFREFQQDDGRIVLKQPVKADLFTRR
ncbi:MAG: class I SAM-dependent methyltransferase [Proteobacteria bacterium]|nr:class I SAM-dependent methyltransferase [Pseudomonadota bacterium]